MPPMPAYIVTGRAACLFDIVQVIRLAVPVQNVARQPRGAHGQVEVVDLQDTTYSASGQRPRSLTPVMQQPQ